MTRSRVGTRWVAVYLCLHVGAPSVTADDEVIDGWDWVGTRACAPTRVIALEDEFGLHIRDGRMDATVTRSSSAGVWALYLHRDDPVPWTYAEERLVLRAGDVFSKRLAGVLIPLPEHAERLEVPYP